MVWYNWWEVTGPKLQAFSPQIKAINCHGSEEKKKKKGKTKPLGEFFKSTLKLLNCLVKRKP